MGYYNPVQTIDTGSLAEIFTTSVNESTLNLAEKSILCLTTAQRLNLDPTLKIPERMVYDTDLKKFYIWELVGGIYDWVLFNFGYQYFNYKIQTRSYTYTLAIDSLDLIFSNELGVFVPANETMLVLLDGTVLTYGVNYTIPGTNSKIETTGTWKKGQQITIIIFYADHSTDDTEITNLSTRVGVLEGQLPDIEKRIAVNINDLGMLVSANESYTTKDFIEKAVSLATGGKGYIAPLTIEFDSHYIISGNTYSLTLTDTPFEGVLANSPFVGKLEVFNMPNYIGTYVVNITIQLSDDDLSYVGKSYGVSSEITGESVFSGWSRYAKSSELTTVTFRIW